MPIRAPARMRASFTSRQSDRPPCAWTSIRGSLPPSGAASGIRLAAFLVAQLHERSAGRALDVGDRPGVVRDAGEVVRPPLEHHPFGECKRDEPRFPRGIVEADE